MKKIVVKFGGSNLKAKEDVSKLIEVIEHYPVPIVIVISALFGVTDVLVKAVQQVRNDEVAINQLKKNLLDAHGQIIEAYVDEPSAAERIKGKLRNRIEELGKVLLGIHYLGEVPDFAEDIVLSYGERLSSLLLESVLQFRGIPCQEMMPEDMGLITDGEFGNATVNFSASQKRVRKALSGENIFVVPGFYGLSPDGKVTLLGRGGTDYSAAAIARCLGASSVDIWKDVAGFMSADPKWVDNPRVIHTLSYREAAELSYFGARILHPRTFEPVMEKSIPIRLFDIHHFRGQLKPLSVIEDNGYVKEDVVKSVTFSDDLGILKLRGPGVGIKPGIMAKVTNQLNSARINIKSIITAQTSINILVSLGDLQRSHSMISEIGLKAVDEIIRMDNISLIAVVGEGMLEKPGIAARVFGAVSSQNINILIISSGASVVASYFIIESKDRGRAIQAIHKEFFS